MVATLIDGKKIAEDIKNNLKKEVYKLKSQGINPCLAVIFNGIDFFSKKYVALKKRVCTEVGIDILIHAIQEATTQYDISMLIEKLNVDPKINGILLQFPLRKEFDKKEITSKIAPEKDIDGCSPYSIGKLMLGKPTFIPAAPYAVIKMLDAYGIEILNKHIVVVGNNTTGKSLACLFLRKNTTVTICHAKTQNLKKECLMADILCASVKKAKMITADIVKKGAVVIDMGINATRSGKVAGDVNFDAVRKKAAYITPVPGGIGPMTIAMLMHNTVLAAKMQSKILQSV